MKTVYVTILLLFVAAGLSGCGGSSGGGGGSQESSSDPQLPAQLNSYAFELPTHFIVPPRGIDGSLTGAQPAVAEIDNTGSNIVTDAGATLGRVLFYDTKLSADDTVSCASCHIQALGFSDDVEKIVSEGINGGMTRRRSMGLANTRYYLPFSGARMFWDERAASLEEQVLMPIVDSQEMGFDNLQQVEQLLPNIAYYPALFDAAFGTPEVTSDRISKALAQFVRSLVSFDSRYDQNRVLQVESSGDAVASFTQDMPEFTPAENLGKRIFITPIVEGGASCFSCHSTEAFVTPRTGPTSNGLDAITTEDEGVCEPDLVPDERCGKFKVPSLRNVAVRPPFMHDGRFATLEDVIDHYSENIQPHRNLAQVLKGAGGEPVRLNFSPEEKTALVAFLNTLTDIGFLTDSKFSDPFPSE